METTIKTSSYPGGLPEFITPYLQELQENTIIPDYTTLISITTVDNPDQDGIHILTFLKNDPEHFDTMTLQALLASNAYGTHLPMILKHALAKPQS